MQAEVWGYRGEAGEQRKPVCRKKWEERDTWDSKKQSKHTESWVHYWKAGPQVRTERPLQNLGKGLRMGRT